MGESAQALSYTGLIRARTRHIRTRHVPSYTTFAAPRRCSLRHRIPLPTGSRTRRERATTSRCSVHRPAARAPRRRALRPYRASLPALRARPTSGESRMSTRRPTKRTRSAQPKLFKYLPNSQNRNVRPVCDETRKARHSYLHNTYRFIFTVYT